MERMRRPEPPQELVDRLRRVAGSLPDAYEEEAWTGLRWRVRGRTFVHVVQVEQGGSPAFTAAAGTPGPATVITFHAEGPELDYLTGAGPPFFKPPWSPTVIGLVLSDQTDWAEVAELVTDSFCTRAPRKLVAMLRADESRER